MRYPTNQVIDEVRQVLAKLPHTAHYTIISTDRITPTVSQGCRVERDAPAGNVRPLIEPYVQFSRIRLSVWNI